MCGLARAAGSKSLMNTILLARTISEHPSSLFSFNAPLKGGLEMGLQLRQVPEITFSIALYAQDEIVCLLKRPQGHGIVANSAMLLCRSWQSLGHRSWSLRVARCAPSLEVVNPLLTGLNGTRLAIVNAGEVAAAFSNKNQDLLQRLELVHVALDALKHVPPAAHDPNLEQLLREKVGSLQQVAERLRDSASGGLLNSSWDAATKRREVLRAQLADLETCVAFAQNTAALNSLSDVRLALLHLAQAPLHWPAAQSADLAERIAEVLEGMPSAMRPACFAQPLELQALQATNAFSSVVTGGEVPVHEATERLASELLQDATCGPLLRQLLTIRRDWAQQVLDRSKQEVLDKVSDVDSSILKAYTQHLERCAAALLAGATRHAMVRHAACDVRAPRLATVAGDELVIVDSGGRLLCKQLLEPSRVVEGLAACRPTFPSGVQHCSDPSKFFLTPPTVHRDTPHSHITTGADLDNVPDDASWVLLGAKKQSADTDLHLWAVGRREDRLSVSPASGSSP